MSSGGVPPILVNRFTVWDYVVFGCMLAVSAAIGIYYAVQGLRRKSTTDDFLMGGRNMSVFPVALSILASFMSAITLLGTASEMYVYGTQYLFIIFSYCLVIPATAYLYMPVFYKLHVTSAYEYLELRFNHVIRAIGCVTFSVQMLIYMAIVLYAPALALSQVTGISVWTSVLSIGIVCTFYTSFGGMKAVVWTDVFQVCLMFGAMLMVVIRGAYDIGGMKIVFDEAYKGDRIEFFNLNADPTERHTVWGLIIGCFFTWMSIYAVSQAMVQRYLTVPNLKGARTAIWMNLPGLSLLMLICALAGLVMYARYHDCDPLLTKKVTAPDQLLPLFVMDVLGSMPGVPGLFVSGIFSGALSTVSSGVNSLAAVTLEDIIKRYIKKDMSERYATNITKAIAVCFGLVAIALVYGAQMMGNVLQAALSIFGIVGGPLLGVFTLGMFFPCANSIGAGVGTLTSLAVCFWIGFGAFATVPAVHKAPVSVLGCVGEYLNATRQTMDNITFPVPVDVAAVNKDILFVYRISYVWYSMIGCFVVVIVGLIVSLITGFTRPSKVNPRAIHPIYNFICGKVLPRSLQGKFMVESTTQYDTEHMVELGKSKDMTGNLRSEGSVNAGFVSSDEKPVINGFHVSPTSTSVLPVSATLRTAETQSPGGKTEPAGPVANGGALVAGNGVVAHRAQAEDVGADGREAGRFGIPRALGVSEYNQAPSVRDAASSPSSRASPGTTTSPPVVPFQAEQSSTTVPGSSIVGCPEGSSEDTKDPTRSDGVGASLRSAGSDPDLRKDHGAQGYEPGQTKSTREATKVESVTPPATKRSRHTRASKKESHRHPKGVSSPAESRSKSPRPRSPVSDDEMATSL